MSATELKLISVMWVLCKQAQLLYDELATLVTEQQARNIFRTLAQNRTKTLGSLVKMTDSVVTPESEGIGLTELIMQQKGEILDCMRGSNKAQAFAYLVEGRKHEIDFLRQEIRKTENQLLRQQLADFVATLQVDLDQLKALSEMHKHTR